MCDHERCDACGFDGADYPDRALLAAIRALGGRWRRLLADAGAEGRTRPAPQVWSAVEYAAHTRDITALHGFGVEWAGTGDEPVIDAIESDALIESAAETYADEDVEQIADAIEHETGRLADRADTIGPGHWERGLTIGDERMTIRRLLEHALHDSAHHLDDVARGLAQLRVTPRAWPPRPHPPIVAAADRPCAGPAR